MKSTKDGGDAASGALAQCHTVFLCPVCAGR